MQNSNQNKKNLNSFICSSIGNIGSKHVAVRLLKLYNNLKIIYYRPTLILQDNTGVRDTTKSIDKYAVIVAPKG